MEPLFWQTQGTVGRWFQAASRFSVEYLKNKVTTQTRRLFIDRQSLAGRNSKNSQRLHFIHFGVDGAQISKH